MRAALVILIALASASDLLAQSRVMTCRDDGHGGIDCWNRPYNKRALPRQEHDWDRKLDEQRLRDLMRSDQQRERRRQW